MKAAQGRLIANKAQHLEVEVALGVVQRNGLHVVTGNIEQVGIGEMEIVAGNSPGKVVSKAESQGETVKTLGCEVGEIVAPEGLIVIPGLVLHIAHEGACDAPDLVGGLFPEGLYQYQGGQRVAAEAHAIGQFQEPVDAVSYTHLTLP